MIHVVTPNLNRGTVLGVSNVQMDGSYLNSEEELRKVIKIHEKPLI